MKRKKTIKVEFNKKNGNLGVITIDNSKRKSIRFIPHYEVPEEKVKKSSRHIVRLLINENLNEIKLKKLIKELNAKINKIRKVTRDVHLTAFKGLIKNQNSYRRRMDFAMVRKIILSTI